MSYSAFLDDPDKKLYLAFTFEMIKHGVTVAMAPRNLGGDGGLYVDEEYLPLWWYNENIYYNIRKTTEEYLG